MNPNTLVFDFDGTIADSMETSRQIIAKLIQEFGLVKSPNNLIEEFKNMEIKKIIKTTGIPLSKLPLIATRYKKEAGKTITKLKPIKGIETALLKLKNLGYGLGILTSNSQENVEKFLNNHHLTVFDFIYSGADLFGKHKTIRQMLKKQRLSVENVIYVGDETRDVDAAHKAGIKVMAVSWGFNSQNSLQDKQPDYLANSPRQLVNLLNHNQK